MKIRISEHRRDIRNKNFNRTNLSKEVILNGGKPIFEEASILFQENTLIRSEIIETLTIKATESISINENTVVLKKCNTCKIYEKMMFLGNCD